MMKSFIWRAGEDPPIEFLKRIFLENASSISMPIGNFKIEIRFNIHSGFSISIRRNEQDKLFLKKQILLRWDEYRSIDYYSYKPFNLEKFRHDMEQLGIKIVKKEELDNGRR